MIHSMTGFGKAARKCKYGTIGVEIKTLNHKFFEPSIRLPNGLGGLEDRIKNLIQSSVKRGKVYFNVTFEDGLKGMEKISIDMEAARSYKRHLKGLKKSLGLKGDLRLEQFMALPGVINYEAHRIDARKLWLYVRKATADALEDLSRDREIEGKALYRDITRRARDIRRHLKEVSERSHISVSNYKKHLSVKIKELTGAHFVDKGRMEQEVALFAKNCDISEELIRIKAHLTAFEEAIKKDQEVGKKLDFIAQELHREINTIGSKASDTKISKYVIQIKSEVEKIREQVKNVQ